MAVKGLTLPLNWWNRRNSAVLFQLSVAFAAFSEQKKFYCNLLWRFLRKLIVCELETVLLELFIKSYHHSCLYWFIFVCDSRASFIQSDTRCLNTKTLLATTVIFQRSWMSSLKAITCKLFIQLYSYLQAYCSVDCAVCL